MEGKLGCRKGLVLCSLCSSALSGLSRRQEQQCRPGRNTVGGTLQGPSLPWQNPTISKAYLTSHIKPPHVLLFTASPSAPFYPACRAPCFLG